MVRLKQFEVSAIVFLLHGEGIYMKLFLREHRLLIIIQLLQFGTIAGVFWLAGFRSVYILLYSIFLGCFLLFCYLLYHYLSRKKFYQRLTVPMKSIDDSLESLDQVPISESLSNLLKTQYSTYQQQIVAMSKDQEEHLIFMDRWIHQMKTPLSVLELMAKDLDEPESSDFREELDRLKHGLNMVLYMARLRTIEKDFHIKKINLVKLIQDVNQENKRFYIRNNIYPQLSEEMEDVTIESDEKWLFFMLNQLLHNAIKYSSGQSDKVFIRIGNNNGFPFIEITDRGVGIPKEDMNRIFNAFYTGVNGRNFKESTGVGLFLVKEVANYLGHTIEVNSEVGSGTTFRIKFG